MSNIKKDVCDNCIIYDGLFGLEINSKGLCNFCEDPNHVNPNWRKVRIDNPTRQKRLMEWNEIIRTLQDKNGQNEYSCVIGYSGGKDSTALIDTFINEYNLKPFLVTINTGFMTDIAKDNIRKSLDKMNLSKDHIFVEDAIPTFIKLYRHLFLNHLSAEKALAADVCHTCTDLIHTVIVKEAIKKKIDYVFIGFSPDQIARYFFKTPKKDTYNDGLPRPQEFKKEINNEDLKWYLNENTNIDILPQVIYPYHVIEYDENEIINRIEAKGLIDKGKGDPVLTNCHVIKAAMYYDFYRYGAIFYAVQYAELVRQKDNDIEREKARKYYLRLMSRIGKNIKNDNFDSEGYENFLKKIGITKDIIFKIIENQRKNDPNLKKILKNIDVISNKRLK
ncbi:MAG: hypothetical protein KGD63_05370 [Candidatus Lokiarchaeota archaeon]|nr:hypothetical protein [Candidatus Lokiarchaeota archaeon]